MTSVAVLTRAEGGHPADLRLVPAGLAAWLVVVATVGPGPATGTVVGIATAVLAVLAAVGGWWFARPVLLAVAGCAAAAAVVASAHGWSAGHHPLRAPAERAAAAELRVVLRDDPHIIRGGFPGAPQVAVPAELVAAAVDGEHWALGGRVLLLAPAAEWAELLPGQEVGAVGLLAPPARSDLTVAVLRVRGPPHAVSAPPWWQSAAGELRAGLREASSAALSPAAAGLLPGLTVGDRSRLSAEVDSDFRAAGLTHLLAVSGANLAILTGALLWLLRRMRVDPRVIAAVGALVVAGFVVLARPSPSVLRAAVMAGVVLLALGLGRARAAMPALAVAVLVLVMSDPALAVDAGFALSITATAALVLVAPGWAEALRRRRVPAPLAEAIAVAAAACVATAPLMAGLSGTVNPASVVANLLVAPAVPIATVLGVLAALVSPVAPVVAQVGAWLAGPAIEWMIVVADRTAALDGFAVGWPGGTGGAVLLAALLLVVVWLARLRRVRVLLVAVVLGAALVLVPTRFVPVGWPPTGWSMVACDVGQGDALVLATGEPGWAVLVDAGPDEGLVDACLSRLGVQALALVVLTHLHADHVGGLAGAVRDRPVGAVAVGPGREPFWTLRAAARTAAAAEAPFAELRPGQRLAWPALVLDVLGPRHPAAVVDPDDGTAVNDTSVVMRASTPAGTVLLTGDAELAGQADLIRSGVDLHADVLKLPHHGSRSTGMPFLQAVRPRAVLVSVGAGNSYGHPNRALLAGLEQAGATVRRTDVSGDTAVVAGDLGGDGSRLGLVSRGSPLPAARR
ncbi:DNA internalization-related competence protein ComEC/Rec2 [Pseudonocardia sp. CA-107938]|uniref:DNA internalization-related competence protein ComEC/Rec2 n=1 Tax=Pseudonocardia sp. CA-107938 TaxID=3240021 RepID=UPI003D94ADBF